MNKLQPFKPMPPRQFPKQQYQKLGHYIWAWIIGIIIIILLFVTLFMIVIKPTNHPEIHYVVHHVKSSRPIRKPKPIKHRSTSSNITPTQGEKLLGYWLNKLHYPPNKSQEALSHFEKSNQFQEKALARRLTNRQPKQIEKLISHNLLK